MLNAHPNSIQSVSGTQRPSFYLNESDSMSQASNLSRKKLRPAKLVSSNQISSTAKQQFAQQLANTANQLNSGKAVNGPGETTLNGASSNKPATSNSALMSQEEFLALATQPTGSGQFSAHLYASTFIALNQNTQLKTQYDKIQTSASHKNNSSSFLPAKINNK